MSSSANMHDMQIEDVNPTIGARVTELRKNKFSQVELAELLSEKLGKTIDPTTITRLEGGKRPISAVELVALAEIFGIGPVELLPDWRPIEASERYWAQRVHAVYEAFLTAEARYMEYKTQLEVAERLAEDLKLLSEYKRVGKWREKHSEALLEIAECLEIASQENRPNAFIEIVEDLGLTREQMHDILVSKGTSLSEQRKLAEGAIKLLSGAEQS